MHHGKLRRLNKCKCAIFPFSKRKSFSTIYFCFVLYHPWEYSALQAGQSSWGLCALCIECFSKFCGCSRKVQLNKFHWSEIVFLGNLAHFMNEARSLRNRPASSGNIHMNTSLHFTHPLVFRCIAIFAEIVEGALIITAHSLHENNRNA